MKKKEHIMPAVISETVLPDGRLKFELDCGGVFICPPLPGPEWQEGVAKEMSRINYQIIQRIEKTKNDDD